MLTTFRVQNYKSIRNEQELSMRRDRRGRHASADSGKEKSPAGGVLTVAALYGANASGKSNLLRAIRFGRSAVVRSHSHWEPQGGVRGYSPFLLDAAWRDAPTRIEFEFEIDSGRFQFGFECDRDSFLREWLYAFPSGRKQTWYERDNSGTDPWYFGRHLTGPNRVVVQTTRKNSLFLSAAASAAHPQLSIVYGWFAKNFFVASPESRTSRLVYSLEQIDEDARPGRAKRTIDLLRLADLGIQNAIVKTRQFSDTERERFVRLMRALGDPGEGTAPLGDEAVSEALQSAGRYIEFSHEADGGVEITLPFEAESYGTQSLVALSGPILDALDDGDTLAVDEIDASLHPHLVAALIRLFESPATNPRRAQLIFTTHDSSLLANLVNKAPLLDRDEVWLVQKDESGSTTIYPLTDFSPRQQENLERGYLQGRYGGIPFIDEAAFIEHGVPMVDAVGTPN